MIGWKLFKTFHELNTNKIAKANLPDIHTTLPLIMSVTLLALYLLAIFYAEKK